MEILAKLSLIDFMAFLCLAALCVLAWAAESGTLGQHKRVAGFSMLGLVCVFIVVLATSKTEDSLLFGSWEKSEDSGNDKPKSSRGAVKVGGKGGGGGAAEEGGNGPGQAPSEEGAAAGGGGSGVGEGENKGAGGSGKGDGAADDTPTGVDCAGEASKKKAGQDKSKAREELARPGLRPGAALQDCPHCPRMALVPPGCTEIGAPVKQSGFRPEEAPVTRIKIGTPYYIGRYEITRGEFHAFVEATGHAPSQGCNDGEGWKAARNWQSPGFKQDNNHPVVCISWADARAYVDWLSSTTQQSYRLPNEGEWEHAVRAGSKTTFPYGEKIEPADANYGNRLGGTAPVGQFSANAYGLLDTVGNAWEMVQDCWEPNHQGLPLDGTGIEKPGCEERVMRGGGWYDGTRNLRAAARLPRKEGAASWSLGFRVVREHAPASRASAPANPAPADPAAGVRRTDASGGAAGGQRTQGAGSAVSAPSVLAAPMVAAGAAVAGPMVVGGARVQPRGDTPRPGDATPAKGQRKSSDGQGGKRRDRDR